jgi:hypothetical protein
MTSRDPFRSNDPKPGLSPGLLRIVAAVILVVLVGLALLLIF